MFNVQSGLSPSRVGIGFRWVEVVLHECTSQLDRTVHREVKEVRSSYNTCTAVLCAGFVLPVHGELPTPCHLVTFTSISEEHITSMSGSRSRSSKKPT
jgi:hypothetical protein